MSHYLEVLQERERKREMEGKDSKEERYPRGGFEDTDQILKVGKGKGFLAWSSEEEV